MKTSESIVNIAKAFAAAQGELKAVPKIAINPYFSSKYADLSTVIDIVQPVLLRHGLIWLQPPHKAEGGVVIETVLIHAESGEWFSGECFIPAKKQDAQAYGSALTYARRYCLSAMFGLKTTDDDGQGAQEEPEPEKPKVTDGEIVAAKKKLADCETLESFKATFSNLDKPVRQLLVADAAYMAETKGRFDA
ncbi:MAG: hypothetical protein DRP56_09895 [Planctomycetota bacterium]|nr:MAG: hypothetical protein DRP56_09895 [Planctomycetota bacterium]